MDKHDENEDTTQSLEGKQKIKIKLSVKKSKKISEKSERKRKKQSIKASDPIVKDLTPTMTSFLILSPKKAAPTSAASPKPNNSPVLHENDDESDKQSPKVNAFQFMMSNRNKSIGTNSPGKELVQKSSPKSPKSGVKTVRKKLLQEWADQKGGAKSREEYEVVGKCIKYKLNKRKRKLKEMLQAEDLNSDSETKEDEIGVRHNKRKVRAIESDESSLDSMPVREIPAKKRLSLKKVKTSKAITDNGVNSIGNDDIIDVVAVGNESANSSLNNNVVKEARRSLRERKQKPKYDEDFLTKFEEEQKRPKKTPKLVKIAPIFTPKPKLDPEVAEARRQFLLSSLPANLKKELDKHLGVETKEAPPFPSISHVQQLEKSDSPPLKFNFKFIPPTKLDLNAIHSRHFVFPHALEPKKAEFHRREKLVKLRQIVLDLKSENPNFPIYKTFNTLLLKSGKHAVQPKATPAPPKRGRGRPKRVPTPQPPAHRVAQAAEPPPSGLLWTEKYKPAKSDEIFGNTNAVRRLKAWLQRWTSSKRRRADSDFESTDCSGAGARRNAILLSGPCGSGKTSAAYAVCGELNLAVLEVNAAARRTGKWLAQELQEATRSHQVVGEGGRAAALLVEDVDVVFEQDEGFVSALCALIAGSKRPFVLTASEPEAGGIQRLVAQCERVDFVRVKPEVFSRWAQVVCLVEGVHAEREAIEELYVYNRNDARRTLHELQFWCQSGGQIGEEVVAGRRQGSEFALRASPALDSSFHRNEMGEEELSDFRFDDLETEVPFRHRNCVGAFANCRDYGTFTLPDRFDLERVWWNIPSLVCMDDGGGDGGGGGKIEAGKLRSLSRFYDTLSLIDVASKRERYKLKDSLELGFSNQSYADDEFVNDWSNDLVAASILECRKQFGDGNFRFDMGVPSAIEQKWLLKRKLSDAILKEAIPKSCETGRREIAMDYLPMLRDIGRIEQEQIANNTKRRNRFYSYLRELGVANLSEATLRFTCDIYRPNQTD